MPNTTLLLTDPFMNYVIVDKYGGVPDGDQYIISDTPGEEEWMALLSAFTNVFSEFTSEVRVSAGKRVRDFEFPDWHYEMRALFVYLYNEDFYNGDFIPKVQGILIKQKNPAYAEFECFRSKNLLGRLMVFKDKVIFNRLSEERGLLRKLIP